MKTLMKTLMAVCLSVAGYASASAATIFDFTGTPYENAEGLSSYSTLLDGIGITLSTGSTDGLTFNDGTAPGGPITFEGTNLALDGDGIGIGNNDEVNGPEVLTITFDQDVNVSAISFLDIFRNSPTAGEQADINFFADGGASLGGLSVFAPNPDLTGGYAEAIGLGYNGVRSLTIVAPTGPGINDGGNNDVALAALSVSAVPEPATWLMMIMGFGLVGVASRRRKSALTHA